MGPSPAEPTTGQAGACRAGAVPGALCGGTLDRLAGLDGDRQRARPVPAVTFLASRNKKGRWRSGLLRVSEQILPAVIGQEDLAAD